MLGCAALLLSMSVSPANAAELGIGRAAAPEPDQSSEVQAAHIDPLFDELNNRTFAATGIFSDSGGSRDLYDGAWLELTFHRNSAIVRTNCGENQYPLLTVQPADSSNWRSMDFGTPSGPGCRMDSGNDAIDIPRGCLFWVQSEDGHYALSTGYFGLLFEEVGADHGWPWRWVLLVGGSVGVVLLIARRVTRGRLEGHIDDGAGNSRSHEAS